MRSNFFVYAMHMLLFVGFSVFHARHQVMNYCGETWSKVSSTTISENKVVAFVALDVKKEITNHRLSVFNIQLHHRDLRNPARCIEILF